MAEQLANRRVRKFTGYNWLQQFVFLRDSSPFVLITQKVFRLASPLPMIASAFVVLNAAAAVAFYNSIAGGTEVGYST